MVVFHQIHSSWQASSLEDFWGLYKPILGLFLRSKETRRGQIIYLFLK
jgi:hypothetical protein